MSDSKVRGKVESAKELAEQVNQTFSESSKEGQGKGATPDEDAAAKAAATVIPVKPVKDDAEVENRAPGKKHYSKEPQSLIETTVGGEGVVVSGTLDEKGRNNAELTMAALKAEDAAIQQSKKLVQDLKDLKRTADKAFADRAARLDEFSTGYAEFIGDPMSSEEMVAKYGLKVDAATALRALQYKDTAAPLVANSITTLKGFLHPINLKKTQNEMIDVLQPANEILLEDPALGKEVILPLHEMLTTDVFAFLRSQLKQKESSLENLKKELHEVGRAKDDATAIEDVAAMETCAKRQVDVVEQVIGVVRERLTNIFDADGDLKEFKTNYAAARDKADETVDHHRRTIEGRIEAVHVDINALDEIGQDQVKAHEKAVDAHAQWLAGSKQRLMQSARRSNELWIQLETIMGEICDLSVQRKDEVQLQLNKVAEEKKRLTEYASFERGFENHTTALAAALEVYNSSADWLHHVTEFVSKACAETEAKDHEGELTDIRIKEQLEHLTQYKLFRSCTEDFLHRKETKVTFLQRMKRNLGLQIQQATAVLDPNKAKYVADMAACEKDVQIALREVAELSEKLKEQAALWRPTEDLLEEANINFDPPDVEAEKEKCQRKAASLQINKSFLSHEQTEVDMDATNLRKLKTNNLVALEGLQKRRQEKIAAAVDPMQGSFSRPATAEEGSRRSTST